jgi:hypothetical protein
MMPFPVILTIEPPSFVAPAFVVVVLLVIAAGSDWRRRATERTGRNNPERDEP